MACVLLIKIESRWGSCEAEGRGGAPKSSNMTPLLVCMQSREAKLSGFAILVRVLL